MRTQSEANSYPILGVGINFHLPMAEWILSNRCAVDFVEFIVENCRSPAYLSQLIAIGKRLPLVAHGLSMSVGGAEGLDPKTIDLWKEVKQKLSPCWFSEHLAFT